MKSIANAIAMLGLAYLAFKYDSILCGLGAILLFICL